MEAVALLGLAGLGYLVAKTTAPSPKGRDESPKNAGVAEGFVDRENNSKRNLDRMYKTPNSQLYPSEPVPGPYGPPIAYASETPKPVKSSPIPLSVEAVAPRVRMNPSGVEETPQYNDKNSMMVSALSGQRMQASDFTHNNMVPFFGGRIKQNVAVETNTSLLDSFTGAGSTDIRKKEVETMFNTAQTPFGNPYGLENSTEFLQGRINEPRNRAGEKPFEPTRVAAGVGEKFGLTGKGGFQQMEVNEIMRKAMPTTEKLRVADNPKNTYITPVVPGQRFIASSPDNPGEVRKYRPDTFYVDEAGERFVGAFSEESQRETNRPVQVMKFVARPETSSENIGVAASQDFQEGYVSGEYRTPMAQQYGGAGFRNADMTTYYTGNPDQAEADYGRSSIEIRPNERLATTDRVMGLNLAPADTVQVPIHYNDPARPTRREETSGNIRQTATPVGYAQGAPAVTVWDPSDVARTTIKETTINWGNLGLGIASAANQPSKLKVYDPDDIARPTQKAAISAKSEYFGGGEAARKDFTSHDAAYNMRLNPNKEQIAKGRKPIAGNGNVGVFTGEKLGVTYKKLDADIVNDRELTVNNVSGLPPGAGDIGAIKYRAPLKLDISLQRNTPLMVAAVENNPLQQSLRRNAEHDQQLLQQAYGRQATSY